MAPRRVEEAIDVVANGASPCRVVRVNRAANQLGFERTEEALRHRVVPAIAFSTHACDEAEALELGAIVGAGEWTSAVRMVHASARWASRRDGGTTPAPAVFLNPKRDQETIASALARETAS